MRPYAIVGDIGSLTSYAGYLLQFIMPIVWLVLVLRVINDDL